MTIPRREPKALTYQAPIKQRLILTAEVLGHFQAHAQNSMLSPESGGQLFARIDDDIVEVSKATGPYKTDFLSRYFFVPNRKNQNKDIQKLFAQGLHYVGDWHTHPQAIPKPSCTDIGSMKECFAKSKHELGWFVMIIVGTEEAPKGLWVSLHNAEGHLQLAPSK